MTDKPIKLGTGGFQQIAPITTSAGAADSGKYFTTGADGKIDDTFLHDSVSTTFVASEAIAASALINIYDNGGTPTMRNANAASGLQADGFAPAAVLSLATGTAVLGDGLVSGLTLTDGAIYYLSDVTPGGVVSVAPTTTGHLWQIVGKAISTTELAFKLQTPVTL